MLSSVFIPIRLTQPYTLKVIFLSRLSCHVLERPHNAAVVTLCAVACFLRTPVSVSVGSAMLWLWLRLALRRNKVRVADLALSLFDPGKTDRQSPAITDHDVKTEKNIYKTKSVYPYILRKASVIPLTSNSRHHSLANQCKAQYLMNIDYIR